VDCSRPPDERKGKKREFVTALPKQAVALLRDLAMRMQPASLDAYVFPGQNSGQAHMAEKTICTALRTVSGVDDVTAHGTRSLISGLCYEAGYRGEVIEAQLSHAVGTIARERNESVAAIDPACARRTCEARFSTCARA